MDWMSSCLAGATGTMGCMDERAEAGVLRPGDPFDAVGRRRWARVFAALGLLGVCAVALVALATQTTMTYYLPPTEPGGVATPRTEVFGPAVVGVVITGVATLLELGWTAWNLVAHPPRRWWVGAAAVAVVAVVVGFVVTGMARPDF